jgi:hypothetical protein
MRRWTGIGIVSATVVGGALWAHAQQVVPNNPRVAPPAQIISGADIGFRVDGAGPDGKPIGRIVVRQKGEWVEVALSGVGVRRLNAY